MADGYSEFVNSALGRRIAGAVGLPRPSRLRRYRPGDPLSDGEVLVAGDSGIARSVRELLGEWGVQLATRPTTSVSAVLLDMTEVNEPGDLGTVRDVLAPALKLLQPSGRIVVLGRPPETAVDPVQRAARRALEGIVRSVAKEMRAGGTANLVHVGAGGEAELVAPLRFLLSGRSAYVDAQVVRVGAAPSGAPSSMPANWDLPLAGKVAVVTGAARGIGAEIAKVLGRDGATVVCVDVPAAAGPLADVANSVAGSALSLDVTVTEAGATIIEHATRLHGGLDIVVHNAGITRDKLLANTDTDRWNSVLEVNLASIVRMNRALLAEGGIRDGGHLVLVASIAGIAGNRGQANYAASKAGVIGLTQGLAEDPAVIGRGITVNAVAPGFIETEMTAKIPFTTREIGRRLNSLAQGGLPVDVAETISWFAWDAGRGTTGNVVRVCGQSLLGA